MLSLTCWDPLTSSLAQLLTCKAVSVAASGCASRLSHERDFAELETASGKHNREMKRRGHIPEGSREPDEPALASRFCYWQACVNWGKLAT